MTIDIHDNDIGPQMLQVRAEASNYLVMLGEIVNDDYEVRTYFDKNNANVKVSVLGDYWSERQIIKDFDLVVRIFKEFFDTGNVSADILN